MRGNLVFATSYGTLAMRGEIFSPCAPSKTCPKIIFRKSPSLKTLGFQEDSVQIHCNQQGIHCFKHLATSIIRYYRQGNQIKSIRNQRKSIRNERKCIRSQRQSIRNLRKSIRKPNISKEINDQPKEIKANQL